MSQEVEIEGKMLLTTEEFTRLKKALQFKDEDFTWQHNLYFDTEDFQLKEEKSALRAREKKERWTLTLKEPHPDGLLETNQPLTEKEAEQAKEHGVIPDGEVKKQIEGLGIDPSAVVPLGMLSTRRAEKNYQGGLLVLDESHYLDVVDYELEFEGTSPQHMQEVFEALMNDHHIEKKETPNKIYRFFKRKAEIQQDA